jgi:homoserine dehydrogenase
LLASLDGKANALVLDTNLLGEIAICQLEGNLTHTAYALLSDLVTVRTRPVPGAMPAHRIP